MSYVPLGRFVRQTREFFDSRVERRASSPFVWGEGDPRLRLFGEYSGEREEEEALVACRAWTAEKFDAGFGWVDGPEHYGGRGLSIAHARAFDEIECEYKVPSTREFLGVGIGMVAPTILTHGTDLAKERYLRALHRGDIIGCQLFSEPEAGSDLASIQASAVFDGRQWVLNGQKVWTSHARHADIGEILTRTDFDQPKHRGITAFLVNMHAPGVEVMPLRQMNGSESFNQVLLTDVKVSDDCRLGDLNKGWSVAMTTLGNERAVVGAGRDISFLLDRLIAMVRHYGLSEDPLVRDELARLVTEFRVAELTNRRAMASVKAGQIPGPELSIAKRAQVLNLRRASEFAAKVLGARIAADTGEWGTHTWTHLLLSVPGQRIGGGTDEVLRNVAAERVLGLPKEPGIDTRSPFRELLRRQPPKGGLAK